MKTPELDADWHIHLRKALVNSFGEADLKTLCFDLNVDYETLSGEGRVDKIIELIKYFARLGRITDLIDYCRNARPNVAWDEIRAAALVKPLVVESEPDKARSGEAPPVPPPSYPSPPPSRTAKWMKVGGLIVVVVLAAVVVVNVLPNMIRGPSPVVATPAPMQPTSQPAPVSPPTPTLFPTLVPTMAPTLTPCPQGLPGLGCPTSPNQKAAMARQPFERGRMIWVGGGSGLSDWEKVVVVLSGTGLKARWQRFADTFQEGQPESDPRIVPTPGLYQPIRGFGKVWRDELGGVLAPIGRATDFEKGVDGGGHIQLYEGGVVLRLTDPDEVLLLANDHSWWVEE